VKHLYALLLILAAASIAWGQSPKQNPDDVSGIWVVTWEDTGLKSQVILSQSKGALDRDDIKGSFLSDDGHTCHIFGKDVVLSVNFDIQCESKNILLDGLLKDLQVKGNYWSGTHKGTFVMDKDPCQSPGGCEKK
jgi:hypothetical protein